MINIKEDDILRLFRGEKYTYLLEEFEEEKIISRFAGLYDYLDSFIKANKLEEQVYICLPILKQVLVDYFVDIYRLKKFHRIRRINENKIHAYTAYWLAAEKTLQICQTPKVDKRLTTVNEWMVTSYLIDYMFGEPGKSTVINEKNAALIRELKNNLLYSFRYRTYTPHTLESILTAFQAGAAWQYSVDYKA